MDYAASSEDIEAPALLPGGIRATVEVPLTSDPSRPRPQRSALANVAVRAATNLGTLCLCCTAIFCVLAPVVWIPFALKVWVEHSKEPCDQPLPAWLESYLLYTLLIPYLKQGLLRTFCGWNPSEESEAQQPRRVRFFNQFLDALPLVWFAVARKLIADSKTCKTTNPTLFQFVDWYSSFMLVFMTIKFAFYAIGVVLLHQWVNRNGELPEWVQNILQKANAASPDTIHKIQTVQYEASLFADPSDPADERPAGECCICLQPYDEELEIKRTKCGHLAHTSCLEEWLKRARTCPTCRKDLEEACNEEANLLPEEEPLAVAEETCDEGGAHRNATIGTV